MFDEGESAVVIIEHCEVLVELQNPSGNDRVLREVQKTKNQRDVLKRIFTG